MTQQADQRDAWKQVGGLLITDWKTVPVLAPGIGWLLALHSDCTSMNLQQYGMYCWLEFDVETLSGLLLEEDVKPEPN